MSNLIRREDALDAITNIDTTIIPFPKAREYVEIGFEFVINRLKKLPSAEPERKKGKWIEDETGYGFWICSACGFASEAFGANILYPFCPNCGAKLDWSDDE